MKIQFETRLEGINWIARHAEDEGQFEVLREQLNYNFIYHGEYFLDLAKPVGPVVQFENRA